jgi:hypothetical protein
MSAQDGARVSSVDLLGMRAATQRDGVLCVPHPKQAGCTPILVETVRAAATELIALRAAHAELEAHWCKDGETLAERLQRERDDSLALMGLLAAEKQRAKDAEERHAALLAAVRERAAAEDGVWLGSRYYAAVDALRALVAAQGPEGGER